MKLTKSDFYWLVIAIVIVSLFALRSYLFGFIPLKSSNRWTSGVIYKKNRSGQSNRFLYYEFCVEGNVYTGVKNVLSYSSAFLDSTYLVMYNPRRPSLNKLISDLQIVGGTLCDNLDSLKNEYDRELNFWKDF